MSGEFIETQALLLALENDPTLEKYLRENFLTGELGYLDRGCLRLEEAISRVRHSGEATDAR